MSRLTIQNGLQIIGVIVMLKVTVNAASEVEHSLPLSTEKHTPINVFGGYRSGLDDAIIYDDEDSDVSMSYGYRDDSSDDDIDYDEDDDYYYTTSDDDSSDSDDSDDSDDTLCPTSHATSFQNSDLESPSNSGSASSPCGGEHTPPKIASTTAGVSAAQQGISQEAAVAIACWGVGVGCFGLAIGIIAVCIRYKQVIKIR